MKTLAEYKAELDAAQAAAAKARIPEQKIRAMKRVENAARTLRNAEQMGAK